LNKKHWFDLKKNQNQNSKQIKLAKNIKTQKFISKLRKYEEHEEHQEYAQQYESRSIPYMNKPKT
jgi:hypothetical protein